ncbi:carcinoembryonic antigen-related cell adhesion molecule 6-like isoform X5 [Mobula hypostoma]|uniref:carcinoembryonic antigen-related cell adhesion molecule 6-like isoform X5 n=1 Tax=Mobula hypostoma TaxID=723540 RepID=UPI002FC3A95D
MPFCLPSVTDDRSCSIDMTVLPIAALVLCFFIPAGEGLSDHLWSENQQSGESQQFTITVENSQINKPVGSDALFSVRPSSKVRSGDWSINGTLVVRWIDQTVSADNEYTSRAELFTSNGSLRLKSVNMKDSGEYRVNMIPVSGSQSSATITLKVLEFVSQVTITSNDTTALENNTVALTCEANGTIQERTWLKDNKIIPNNSRISMSSNNITLSITRIHRNDAGIYTCVVSNDFSNGSAVIHLKVSYGPENIKIQPQGPVMATIGKTLYCSAVSVPVEYKWFKWTNMLQTEQNYTFESVREVDSGNYTCQVYNSVTKESISLSVKVIAQDSSSGLSAGAIAGIVIAVIAVVALVIVLVFWIIKKKAHRLNAGHDKSDPKTTSPENIQSSQTEYAEIERKIPSQPKPTPSSNGTNAAPAQAKDGYVIYTRPNIINAGAKPTSEPMIDNRTDYAEVKYR